MEGARRSEIQIGLGLMLRISEKESWVGDWDRGQFGNLYNSFIWYTICQRGELASLHDNRGFHGIGDLL